MPEKKQKTEMTAAPHTTYKTSSQQWPLMAGTVAAQAWMDVGTETLRFIWSRMQQDHKAQQELLACTSMKDLQQVHAAFMCQAREQYVTETRKMIDLMSKAATAGIAAGSTARRYDDVPL